MTNEWRENKDVDEKNICIKAYRSAINYLGEQGHEVDPTDGDMMDKLRELGFSHAAAMSG